MAFWGGAHIEWVLLLFDAGIQIVAPSKKINPLAHKMEASVGSLDLCIYVRGCDQPQFFSFAIYSYFFHLMCKRL